MAEEKQINKNHMKDKLNRSQWNALRITMYTFEKNLRSAQAWLDGTEESGTFYERKLHLSAKRREQARKVITDALQTVIQLGNSLDLSVKEENAASKIRGEMSVSWANLLDMRAGKLSRYGKVHPDLSSELDPIIEQLAEMALHLSAIFDGTE